MVRLSASPKIKIYLDLVEGLRNLTDPAEAVYKYTEAMQQVYGGSGCVYLCTRGLPPGKFRITRMRRPDGAEVVPRQSAQGYFELPIHEGGFLGDVLAVGESHITQEIDLTHDPLLGEFFPGKHTAMVATVAPIPFPADYAIIFDRDVEHYTPVVLDEFIMRVSALTALINQLYLTAELKDAHKFIKSQILEIARIQRSLLPQDLPKIPGLELAILYETFDMAGGDMYDIIRMHSAHEHDPAKERWAIFVADASGHGPAAAVVMAMVHAILHAARKDIAGPADALRHLNRQLCAMRIGASFVTGFLIFYEPEESRMIYSRAGHNPPVHRSSTGKLTMLDAVGEIPLGIDPEIQYTQTAIEVRSGDTVLVYTDGIVEALAIDGAMFGMDGISKVFETVSPRAPEVVREIRDAIAKFQGDARPNDDQTIVAIHVL